MPASNCSGGDTVLKSLIVYYQHRIARPYLKTWRCKSGYAVMAFRRPLNLEGAMLRANYHRILPFLQTIAQHFTRNHGNGLT